MAVLSELPDALPLPTLQLSPSSGSIYNLDEVSVGIQNANQYEFCTVADDDPNADLSLSHIQYVQFGYSYTTSQNSVILLPSPDIPADDGKDWYGCNGWGLRFDIKGAGISSPTNLYLAARLVDKTKEFRNGIFPAKLFPIPNIHTTMASPICSLPPPRQARTKQFKFQQRYRI